MKYFEKYKFIKHIIIPGYIILLLWGCSGTKGIREYKSISVKSDESVKMEFSPDRVDNEKSYEVFFKLEKTIDCLRISIISKYIPDRFSGKKEHLMTYFVLDQLIDLSMFKGIERKYEISEIGRNFDSNWNRKRDLTVCEGPEFPLLKLDDKRIYRLRFTTFREVNLEFSINIHADCKVFYIDKPELLQNKN